MFKKLDDWLGRHSTLVFMTLILGASAMLWVVMVVIAVFLWKWIIL